MRKRLLLSGSFRTKEEDMFLRDLYNTLIKEYDVWWAAVEIERGYGVRDENLKRKIIETEKEVARTSNAIVAVMKRFTAGTWGEVLEGYDHGVPAVTYILPDNCYKNLWGLFGDSYNPDFKSAWFSYHVKQENVVYNKDDLFRRLREILV
jgi:hypothetical protein